MAASARGDMKIDKNLCNIYFRKRRYKHEEHEERHSAQVIHVVYLLGCILFSIQQS